MLISFFEEFPTKKNLDKLKLIKFPTKLYLAAKSLKEFNKIKSKINNKNIKEFIYWPLLEIKEGYWFSPFSQRKALKRIFQELENKKISVMLDLELPTTKNPRLYLTQLLNFSRNKSLTKKFIENYPGKIYLAEYYPEGSRKEKILQFLGLHYQNKKANVIKMVYHSMHHFDEDFIRKQLTLGKKEYPNHFLVAYGTIAKGIAGWEPILSSQQLKKDLQIAKEVKLPEIILYRLGGLNEEYLRTIKTFV
jgi:hypothetical protein